MAQAALIASGAGLMAAGQIKQGKLAETQGRVERDIAIMNAREMEKEAESRKEAAAMEEERIALQQNMFIGSQLARIGKGGIAIGEGSSLDSLADSAYQFALDRALTLRAGTLQSSSLKRQATLTKIQGSWAAKYGKEMKRAAYLQAAGTILSGGFMASRALPASPGGGNQASLSTPRGPTGMGY